MRHAARTDLSGLTDDELETRLIMLQDAAKHARTDEVRNKANREIGDVRAERNRRAGE